MDKRHTLLSNYNEILDQIRLQTNALDMPYTALARRSGVSLPTVKRIMAGDYTGARFDYILKICEALGIHLVPSIAKKAVKLRMEQASAKAVKIARQVQGTSALEGQGLTKAQAEIWGESINRLLAGSGRDLWDE